MIGLLRVPPAAATAQGTPVRHGQVPLAEIARIGRGAGPLTVTRQGQFPAVTIGFDLAPGASLGDAVAAIRRGGGRDRPAGHHQRQLRRRRGGVPALAAAASPG